MAEGQIVLLRLGINQHGVALIERAALRILAGEPYGRTFEKQGAKRQSLGKTIINGPLPVTHLGALLEQFHNFRMNVKAFGHVHEAVGDIRKPLPSQSRVNLIFWFVAPMGVRRPIIGQLAEMWNLSERPGFGLLLFVLFAERLRDSGCINASGLGINLPKLRMLLDAFIEFGLRDRGVVHFAMAVAAVADE